ncbi:APC family permease [Nonomuraea sp. NPDC050556]|uniref:APC family permease n=1 Tax=Nonomuraea sp. NPDC050556 TaxID=3364369 RepID=UPI0037AB5579
MADELVRRLGTRDAVFVGLSAMVGAGVFAVFAPAAASAGSWLLVALGVAAVVAYCNATSSARLAALYPASGGTYVYGTRRLGPFWGYLAGWGFVTGKTASCAAMALTFGAYVAPGLARPLAVGAVVALTGLNLLGVQRSALAARIMVSFVLFVLAAVATAALLGPGPSPNSPTKSTSLGTSPGASPSTSPGTSLGTTSGAPLGTSPGTSPGTPSGTSSSTPSDAFLSASPGAAMKVVDKDQRVELTDLPADHPMVVAFTSARLTDGPDIWGVLQGAGLLFFAFAGYARIATLGEEVRDPSRTIPRAIGLALAVALAVYAVIGYVALSVLGPSTLAQSPAPLVSVVDESGVGWLAPVVKAGAAVAALGALLALILGVSRTVFAMARERDLPGSLAAVHPSRQVPHRAELVVGVAVILLILVADLRGAIGFSSFGVLVYYAVANASAFTLTPDEGAPPKAIPVLGLALCALLAATLPWPSVAAGLAVFAVGTLLWLLKRRLQPT